MKELNGQANRNPGYVQSNKIEPKKSNSMKQVYSVFACVQLLNKIEHLICCEFDNLTNNGTKLNAVTPYSHSIGA